MLERRRLFLLPVLPLMVIVMLLWPRDDSLRPLPTTFAETTFAPKESEVVFENSNALPTHNDEAVARSAPPRAVRAPNLSERPSLMLTNNIPLVVPNALSLALSIPFRTLYTKTHCGARVRNFCVKDGQPRYYADSDQLLTKSGATTVCNEAARKSKLHMVMHSPPPNKPPVPLPDPAAGQFLFVPFCWELYGYHLILCIMSVWANGCRHGYCVGFSDKSPSAVYVGYLKGSSLFPYLRGSDKSWDDPVRELSPLSKSRAVGTPYWPLWKVLADHPSTVMPLPDLKHTCFSAGLLGHIPSVDVTPNEQQWFRLALLRRVLDDQRRFDGLPSPHEVYCPWHPAGTNKAFRITIIQREQRYRIRNIDQVVRSLTNSLTATFETRIPAALGRDAKVTIETRVVFLENMTVREQASLAAYRTDLLVGVHGNGLSWSLMLPPGSAMLELWPHTPYNTNYVTFAQRGNIAYFAVNGDGICKARCGANYSHTVVGSVAEKIARHFIDVGCEKKAFNESAKFFEAKVLAEKRKQERLKSKSGL